MTGAGRHEVGRLDYSSYIADLLAGRATLQRLIDEGLFAPVADRVFTHRLHVRDVDTWLAYRRAGSARSVLDPAIAERARTILAGEPGELQVVERGRPSSEQLFALADIADGRRVLDVGCGVGDRVTVEHGDILSLT